MERSVISPATCMACGCVCDDIELHSEAGRIVQAEPACSLGKNWFLSQTAERLLPDAVLDDQPVSTDAAIATAAQLLHEARWPLVFGLGHSNVEAQREAVWLAELLGGVIDTHTSLNHGASNLAAQFVGKVACTLGEVRNRADLLIYWGANPEVSHPRHLSRYTLTPAGKFTPGGRADRTLIVIDVQPTATSALADRFLAIQPGTDFEVLTALRALLYNRPVDAEQMKETGLTVEQLRELLDIMKQARFGVFFFGSGLTATRGKHLNAAAILALTAELNAFTKFSAIPLRDHGNEVGADQVLSWTTAYPFGVDFSRGYPRSNPGEFTAVDLLVRREVDAAVMIGPGPNLVFPPAALKHLARIPTVVIDSRIGPLSQHARIHITTAVAGISDSGTAYRMDSVPLPLRPILQSPYPSEQDVLHRLGKAVVARTDPPA